MNITSYIENINDVNIQSKSDVCCAIMNIIDKNELVVAYQDDNIFDNIILESMMIFMESKNRERDKTPRNEISKWMESKGFWYTGDNPNKKKRCMRAYHLLQQHKFDPKTETYESDIKEPDGSPRRIKLNILGPNSEKMTDNEEEYKTIKELLKKGKGYINNVVTPMTSDEMSTYNQIVNYLDTVDATRKGNNAFYNYSDDSITIGFKRLQDKQFNSQKTLKHEEGHAKSANDEHNNTSKLKRYTKEDAPEAAKAIEDHKKSGKYVNSHDNDPEELMADLYAAMNATIRTKDWGKNKTTRKITKREIARSFNNFSKLYNTEKIADSLIEYNNKRADNIFDKIYPELKNKIHRMLDDIETKQKSNNTFNFSHYNTERMAEDLVYEIPTKIGQFLSNYKEYDINLGSKLNKRYALEDYKMYSKQLETARKVFNNILEAYQKHGIHNIDELFSYMKDHHINTDDESKCLFSLFRYANNMSDIIKNFDKKFSDVDYAFEQTSILNDIKDMKKFKEEYSGRYVLRIKKELDNGLEYFKKHKEFPKDMETRIMGNIKAIFIDVEKKVRDNDGSKTRDADIDKLKKQIKESTELRNNFVQSMIKEYFDELFSDNIYLD